jgi:hypothetical protein
MTAARARSSYLRGKNTEKTANKQRINSEKKQQQNSEKKTAKNSEKQREKTAKISENQQVFSSIFFKNIYI